MSGGFEEVPRAVLTLLPAERAQIASALLSSLDDPADDQAEVPTSWTAEFRARIDDVRSGRVQTIPLEQVSAELAERRASRLAAGRQD
jgi:putative addiction module component (TIGR02574 family)